jgi:heterotetrameric sarcosine oxidase gamma subunit
LPDLRRPDRRQLVGLLSADPTILLEEGAQITEADPGPAIGYVTSAYRSPTLSRGFALALLAAGRSRIGTDLLVAMPQGAITVTVTDHVFVDQPGTRLRPPPPPRPPIEPLLPPGPEPVPLARPSEFVRLAILAPTTRLSIRAGPPAATAIGLALGVLLPTVPCRSVIARDRAALWLGPDEWLVVAPENAADLAATAVKAAGEHPAAVIDVSHRSRTLELTGERAAWCLNAFCALDLHQDAFPAGMCTRTRFGQVDITLWRIAPEVFHLDVARSLVAYVWACLEEARLEFTTTGG